MSIAGAGLSKVTADEVLFGSVPAAAVISATDTLLVVVSPSSPALGIVPLSIVTANSAYVWQSGFGYQMEISSIFPVFGAGRGRHRADDQGVRPAAGVRDPVQ